MLILKREEQHIINWGRHDLGQMATAAQWGACCLEQRFLLGSTNPQNHEGLRKLSQKLYEFKLLCLKPNRIHTHTQRHWDQSQNINEI